jgi:peptidoglycan/LPS O-acetylase OafA/YrhL
MPNQIADQQFKHSYVPAFDGLRGIVLTVLFVHLEALCPIFEGHVKTKFILFSQTWYTLNIFFCLSGFLITWLLLKELEKTGKLDLLRFYKRRTVRLLPAYLTAIAVSCYLATRFGYAPKAIFHSAILFLTYTYNIAISMYGGYYSYALGFILLPAWSLCVEEQFYFAWSVALKWLKIKYALRAMIATLIFMEVYRCGLMYYMRHAGYSTDQIGAHFYFGTDVRINAILIGCAAALALQNRKYYDVARKYLSAKALPFALPVIIAAVVFFTAKDGEPSLAYQIYGGVLSLSLLAAWIVSIYFQPMSLVSRALALRPCVLLGRISYGLYIFHFIVIRVVARFLHIEANITTPGYSVKRNIAAWFLVTVITILISYAHFYLIELPLQRKFKGSSTNPDKSKSDLSLTPALQPQATGASFATNTQQIKS